MSKPQQDALHGITQDARRLLQALGPTAKTTSGTWQKSYPRPQLAIPLPQPITSLFVARGLKTIVAEKLNQTYLEKASSLKKIYEDGHRLAIEQYLASGAFRDRDMDQYFSATRSAFISLYNQNLQDWRSKIDEVSRSHSSLMQNSPFYAEDKSSASKSSGNRHSSFKNSSVPILEKAFSVNAYPSRADKEGLAEETGMEYKQINIWFQNRRARSKKEGFSIERTATFAPQIIPRYMTTSPSPEPLLGHALAKDSSMLEEPLFNSPTSLTADLLTVTRPSYVFPTPYPPLDTSPLQGCVGIYQTPWLRKCSTTPMCRPSADVEQITSQMRSLVLSDDTSGGHITSLPSFAVILPRAPLPALIRTATTFSRAAPVATLVSAAGASPSSKSAAHSSSNELYRAVPARLPLLSIERQTSLSSSPVTSSRPMPILYSRTAARRSRRSEIRSPSPPYASRSSSWSSTTSTRSSSSSWSAVSSIGPLTPTTSPRIEPLSLAKDVTPSSTLAYGHRSSSIPDDMHTSSSYSDHASRRLS